MSHLRLFLACLLSMISLASCSSHSVVGKPGAEEAARNMEESKQEYQDCIAQRSPGHPTCSALKDLYQQDKAEYEDDVR